MRRHAIRVVSAVVGLALFLLALELLKAGAAQVSPVLTVLRVSGLRQSVGFGWLGAYIILSGSPVAAISLTLFSIGSLSDIATLGMLTGSRLGASFIVLFVGFFYHLRGHRRIASVAVGVLAFLVTTSIYLPALALGVVILQRGWLDAIHIQMPGGFTSLVDLAVGPVLRTVEMWLPDWSVFLLGAGALLCAFQIFDRALPEVGAEQSRFSRLAQAVYRPWVMFVAGGAITTITLSVSVSLSLLVPLAARGYIRRENVVPYILGANITTFIDTLVASLLLNTPRAFTIVLVELTTVALFSLLILFLGYRPYFRLINRLLDMILMNRWALGLFVACTVGIPLLLLFV